MDRHGQRPYKQLDLLVLTSAQPLPPRSEEIALTDLQHIDEIWQGTETSPYLLVTCACGTAYEVLQRLAEDTSASRTCDPAGIAAGGAGVTDCLACSSEGVLSITSCDQAIDHSRRPTAVRGARDGLAAHRPRHPIRSLRAPRSSGSTELRTFSECLLMACQRAHLDIDDRRNGRHRTGRQNTDDHPRQDGPGDRGQPRHRAGAGRGGPAAWRGAGACRCSSPGRAS